MSRSLVIIPTFNEKENIESIVREVFSQVIPFHLLVVDDNSPDGTAEIIEELQQDIFYKDRLFIEKRKGKQGLGTAYIHGFKYALKNKYDYIFEMDADFSHDPAELVELFKTCSIENFDLAIGSRYVQGVNVVNWPIGRVLMSIFASWYVRTITGMPVHDATAGFKCYKRKVLETIELDRIKFIGYAFQIEMKFSAWRCGFKIKEIPIIFTDRTRGESKMSKGIFTEAVFGVIQMKVKSWFRKYPKAN